MILQQLVHLQLLLQLSSCVQPHVLLDDVVLKEIHALEGDKQILGEQYDEEGQGEHGQGVHGGRPMHSQHGCLNQDGLLLRLSRGVGIFLQTSLTL